MVAMDPTYPLYPVAAITSAATLSMVLLTSAIRKNWNLGVASLYFWLFFENLTAGINAIIWVDNADIKFYVYCDIGTCPSAMCFGDDLLKSMAVSRIQVITSVVKPMATLVITRRLYLITNRRSADLLDEEMVSSITLVFANV